MDLGQYGDSCVLRKLLLVGGLMSLSFIVALLLSYVLLMS